LTDIRYAPITIDDVEAYRLTRLRALKEDASAFSARFEDWSSWPMEVWVERVRENADHDRSPTHLAWSNGEIVGMATGVLADPTGTPELVGMWVAPEARGRGVGVELVRRVGEWASSVSPLALELWVMTGNNHAIALYERCGFDTKPDHRAAPDDPCRNEVRMRRRPE